jgi:hypothetical protein
VNPLTRRYDGISVYLNAIALEVHRRLRIAPRRSVQAHPALAD